MLTLAFFLVFFQHVIVIRDGGKSTCFRFCYGGEYDT